MQARTWSRIYQSIEERQRAIVTRRKNTMPPAHVGINTGSDGIAILNDPLAREWQYLDNLRMRVGCHYGYALDAQSGMRQRPRVTRLPALPRPR